MQVNCKTCKEDFELNEKQKTLVLDLNSKGASLAMLKCKLCYQWFPFDPQTINGDKNISRKKEVIWRSPISGVLGYVSFVENKEESFYGCGETGIVWFEKEEFYKAIEEIIIKYGHRKGCYTKVNDEWLPSPNEPDNIDDLIREEDFDDLSSFE